MTYGTPPKLHALSRLLPSLLLLILLAGCADTEDSSASQRIRAVRTHVGDNRVWSLPSYDDSRWERRGPEEVDSQRRTIWVRSHVSLGHRRNQDRPIAVHVAALAAYEVFWNGRLIGRSGSPASSAAAERQGEIDGHFAIPLDLIRQRDNLLAMRLSSFHLPMRVRHTLLYIAVGDLEAGSTQALRTYVAAILAAGVLLLGGAYFGFLYRADRTDRASLLLALLSLTVLAQFSLEVSRAFIGYPYGLQLWRVGAIFTFASIFGVLLVTYVRQQFQPAGGKLLIWGTVLWCPTVLLLFEGFDDKTYAVILGSAAAASAAVFPAALKGSRSALLTGAGTLAMTLPLVGAFPAFLDQDFYAIASALVAGLCLYRALVKPLNPIVQPRPANAGEEDMRVPVLSARGIELCDPRSFLMIKGADDYAEIFLRDGSIRLHRGRLNELEARLSTNFLRVHRSYIVNMDRALELASASGSLHLRLEGDIMVPVSRTYSRSVRARFRCLRKEVGCPPAAA